MSDHAAAIRFLSFLLKAQVGKNEIGIIHTSKLGIFTPHSKKVLTQASSAFCDLIMFHQNDKRMPPKSDGALVHKFATSGLLILY